MKSFEEEEVQWGDHGERKILGPYCWDLPDLEAPRRRGRSIDTSTICGRSLAPPALCLLSLLSGSIFSSVSDGVLFLTSFTRIRGDDSFSNLPLEQTRRALCYLFIFSSPDWPRHSLFICPLFFVGERSSSSPPSPPSPSTSARPVCMCGCVGTAVSLGTLMLLNGCSLHYTVPPLGFGLTDSVYTFNNAGQRLMSAVAATSA